MCSLHARLKGLTQDGSLVYGLPDWPHGRHWVTRSVSILDTGRGSSWS